MRTLRLVRGLAMTNPFVIGVILAMHVTGALAGGKEMTLTHGGLERVVWLFDGRTEEAAPAPLVLALHGYRNPEEAAALREAPEQLGWRRLEAVAEREGFVAVFPAAYRGQWSLVPGLKNSKREDGQPIDDVGFLRRLVADLQESLGVDPSRVYITGISDGAIMTHRLICLQDTPFAAAATLIGTAHEDHIGDCRPKSPPALVQVHGDDDRVLPYDGWIFKNGREVSVAEVMDHWRRLHGCTGQKGERLPDHDPNDGSTVFRFEWTGCVTEPNVLLFKVRGGGHRVPARDAEQRDDPKKKINRDLDTMEEIWRFMSAARRPSAR